MKYTVMIGAALAVFLSGCQAQGRTESFPASPPASLAVSVPSDGQEDAGKTGQVMAPVQAEIERIPQRDSDMISLWGAQVGKDYARYRETGREDGPLYYLYITDPEGNPVPNLNCYTDANWEAGLRGTDHLRGTSMEGGLLPVVLSFREAERGTAELTLVDPNSGEALSVEADLLELGWRYALHVIWDKAMPGPVADGIEVSVLLPDGAPAVGAIVELRGAFRFADQEGKAYFPKVLIQKAEGEGNIVVRNYLHRFREGTSWVQRFSTEPSGSGQYIVMLKEQHMHNDQ